MPRDIELKAPPGKAAGLFLIDATRNGIWPQGGFSDVSEAIRRVIDGNRGRDVKRDEYFAAYGPNGELLA